MTELKETVETGSPMSTESEKDSKPTRELSGRKGKDAAAAEILGQRNIKTPLPGTDPKRKYKQRGPYKRGAHIPGRLSPKAAAANAKDMVAMIGMPLEGAAANLDPLARLVQKSQGVEKAEYTFKLSKEEKERLERPLTAIMQQEKYAKMAAAFPWLSLAIVGLSIAGSRVGMALQIRKALNANAPKHKEAKVSNNDNGNSGKRKNDAK